jgi:hypothetical protein
MPSKFSEKIFTSLRPSYEDPCQLVEKPPSLRIASVLQRGCTLSRYDVSKTRGTPWNFWIVCIHARSIRSQDCPSSTYDFWWFCSGLPNLSGRDNLISVASASQRWRDCFGTRSNWRSEWLVAVNFHKLSTLLEHALSEHKTWTKTFMSVSHHMKINQGFIIKSSRSKENCEVIYNICLKLSILKCTLYYMHYVTTIV